MSDGLRDLGFSGSDYPATAEYTVKTYGDGKSLEALGPITVDQIVRIFSATARQSSAGE